MLRQGRPDCKVVPIWKDAALSAAKAVLKNFTPRDNIQIIVRDVLGTHVDTCPVDIGVALIIGVYEYLDMPLNGENQEVLKQFVAGNRNPFEIPDFDSLRLLRNPD